MKFVSPDRFLILTRQTGAASELLRVTLAFLGQVEAVVDTAGGEGVWYADSEVAGYEGLMGQTNVFPPLTAWSRAFYHLSLTLGEEEAVWFIEEDVAGSAECWEALGRLTEASGADLAAWDVRSREEDPGWYFWNTVDPWFPQPWKAFQPLCRVSARLIRAALAFREEKGRFTFHEGLLASLAAREGMKLLDWARHPECRGVFGTFRFRPVVTVPQRGICHPVKDARLHEVICGWPEWDVGGEWLPDRRHPRPEAPLMPQMSSAYLNGWTILEDDYLFLVQFCREHGIRQVLEFGPGDSTAAFLDAGCRVLSFESDPAHMEISKDRFAGEKDVELKYGEEAAVPDRKVLPWIPDLIFIDGPPLRPGQEYSHREICEWALAFAVPVLLHDAHRKEETATLQLLAAAGCHVEVVPTRKGLALILPPGFVGEAEGDGGGSPAVV